MDPLDAKVRCLELARAILADAEEPATLKNVIEGAKVLWAWATEGLYQTTDDDEEAVTRQ